MSPEGSLIREGLTDILVPTNHSTHGPGKKSGEVFFNQQMSFNRDVSVMLLRSLNRPVTVADAMTATGSRAVRIANEVPDTEVIANDISPAAIPWIRRNIEINRLDNCRESNLDIHILMSEQSFGYVDLDPFGSPVPYLQSAIRGVARNGILAVTATDTAPLAGAHAAKCRRRYQSEPVRGYMCHQGGLRILMCTVARELAKFDRGMRPLLSFYADHYYRTYVRVEEGAAVADRALSQLGYMHCSGLERSSSPTRDPYFNLGPFWLGPLHDKEFLRSFTADGTANPVRCGKYINLWQNELNVPFLYDVSELSSLTKLSPPKMSVLISMLQSHGNASLTHFSPTAFLTDIPPEELVRLYTESGPDSQ